jgi:hypothetical protein
MLEAIQNHHIAPAAHQPLVLDGPHKNIRLLWHDGKLETTGNLVTDRLGDFLTQSQEQPLARGALLVAPNHDGVTLFTKELWEEGAWKPAEHRENIHLNALENQFTFSGRNDHHKSPHLRILGGGGTVVGRVEQT